MECCHEGGLGEGVEGGYSDSHPSLFASPSAATWLPGRFTSSCPNLPFSFNRGPARPCIKLIYPAFAYARRRRRRRRAALSES